MKRLLLGILAFWCIAISSGHAQVMNDYCVTPPFVNTVLKPNVLVVLDNSNSMDEDFYGNAAGSFNSTSKMVIGKNALKSIIIRYKDKLRLGVASFKVGSGVAAYHIHNSPYFVSYQLKSYCPNPPPECVDYCKTGTMASKTTCTTACQIQNAAFDPDYFDEIITGYGIGSNERNKYCRLVYPKTQFRETPSNPGIFWYYKQALPYYNSSDDGTDHCYSTGYNWHESTPWDTYSCYRNKTNNSDADSGYITNNTGGAYSPTDSDFAAGFYDFGRRFSWYHVSRTWFKNSSDGNGYIHINADDLVNTSGSDTATFTNAMAKLDPKEGNETGYMSCTAKNDTCPYIISAGLTPTAGTFQSVLNYFKGEKDYKDTSIQYTSPIQYKCQSNFVIFVTDGLPSVKESGAQDTADNLMPGVQSRINALRSAKKTLGVTEYTFDIKTYVLGVGLTADAKAKLDLMATSGGTQDAGLHAYYADNPTALSDALSQIFDDISKRVSSGTAASVLASSEGSGANMLQAVFYPKRFIEGGTEAAWTGELQNLWYYIDPQLNSSTIREDTAEGSTPTTERTLNLKDDYAIFFGIDSVTNMPYVDKWKDSTGTGSLTQVGFKEPIESLKNLWAAGDKLFRRPSSLPRVIKYGKKNVSTWALEDFNIANFTAPVDPDLNNSFTGDPTTAQIIDYTWGIDNTAFRNRTVTVDGFTGVWKLGDIVSSTPRIQSSFPLNSYHLPSPDGYSDKTYLAYLSTTDYKNRGMVYAGANDGMLHAFYLGKLQYVNDGSSTVAKLTTGTGESFGQEKWAYIPRDVLPYLKYLLAKDYCHIFSVDNPVAIFDASTKGSAGDIRTSSSWQTILIGSMGLGGACRARPTGSSPLCNDISSPQNCVNIPKNDIGYSSYFALDISDQNNPKLLWEFTDPALGFSTSGPAIVRVGNRNENGTWMVVFASGPTGPIDTSMYHQFMGKSDQNLKLFVRDLATGNYLSTIDTGIANAFGGSLYNSPQDLERGAPDNSSNYQDDVLYLGYTTNTYGGDTDTTWSKGGVLRIVTNNSPTVGDWSTSTLISGIGPVTSAVTKLNDKSNHNLWVYFGTGRFYYRSGTNIDDKETQQTIYGIKDPCYLKMINHTVPYACSTGTLNGTTGIADQSTTLNAVGLNGWRINLGLKETIDSIEYGAERVITDPLAVFSGAVFYTTFMPAVDPCSLGGNTALWALKYDTGGPVTLEGKALMQISTGEVKQIDLASAFTEKKIGTKGRRTANFKGMPPRGQGLSVVVKPKPLRKILHMKEK